MKKKTLKKRQKYNKADQRVQSLTTGRRPIKPRNLGRESAAPSA